MLQTDNIFASLEEMDQWVKWLDMESNITEPFLLQEEDTPSSTDSSPLLCSANSPDLTFDPSIFFGESYCAENVTLDMYSKCSLNQPEISELNKFGQLSNNTTTSTRNPFLPNYKTQPQVQSLMSSFRITPQEQPKALQFHSCVSSFRVAPVDSLKRCSICHTSSTPLWRKGLKNEIVCNRCGLRLKRKIGRETKISKNWNSSL